jgi:HD-GYP domain-containing protein (c-di-GMP phosphodiesterase class II)
MDYSLANVFNVSEVTLQDWERRKEFVNFTDEDAELLKKFAPIAAEHTDEIMDALYDHFMSFDETKRFFPDETSLQQVKQLQKEYFLGLSGGEYGKSYLENRLRVGCMHHRISLSPRWYIGAYSVYLQLVYPYLVEALATQSEKTRLVMAFAKLVNLDMELALTAYTATGERLIELEKHRRKELEAIAKASTSFHQAASQSELLSILLLALEELSSPRASIAITITEADSGEQVIERASGQWKSAMGDRLGPSEGITSRVVTTKKPYLDNDFTPVEEPLHTHPNLMALFNALICVPMMAKGVVIGTIWLGRKKPFKDDEVNIILSIGETAASNLQRLGLLDEAKKHLNQLASLMQISQATSSSLELNKVLATIFGQVIPRLGVDAADILLFDSDRQRLIYAAGEGFRTNAIMNTSLRIGQGFAGQAALHKKTIIVPELSLDDPNFVRQELLKDEDFASLYATPLLSADTVIGVMEIFSRKTSFLNKEEINFFEMLAASTTNSLNSARLYSEVKESKIEIQHSYDATLASWVKVLDLRDHETEHHTQRVTDLTLDLAIFLGISKKKDLENIVRGAQLHDIGKIGVSDSILRKPNPLNEKEREIVKQHPALAKQMLEGIPFLRDAIDIPYSHHEKWDGTGYPRGLKGEQIPYFARIFSVTDVWDALTSDRPYRKAWSKKKALKYIQEHSGKHFDPAVVKAFNKILKKNN